MASDGLDLDGVEDAYPLTAAQAGMLFHTISEPGTGVYIGRFDAELPSYIDIDAFKAAWESVVRRHQTLRTVFVWEGLDAPVQVVLNDPKLQWEETRWPEDPEEQQALLTEAQQGGVDLSAAPSTRFVLFRGAAGQIHFAWLSHHAVVDAWSASRVLAEVARIYSETADGSPAELSVPMPFRDFIDWVENADADAAKSYWLRTFGDYETPATIQFEAPSGFDADTPRSQSATMFDLDARATARITEQAKRMRVTPNAILGVLWGIVLHRITGQDDVAFGLAVTQRPPELLGIETAVGNFVTTIPVRLSVETHDSLSTLVENYHEAVTEARQHATLSLNDIRNLTALPASAPFFETIVSVETGALEDDAVKRLFLELKGRDQSNFPLSVIVSLSETLSATILYDNNRFSTTSAKAIADMFKQALVGFSDQLGAVPRDLKILNADANEAANSAMRGDDLPPHELVLDDILSQSRQRPEQIALIGDGTTITYGALDELSEGWARALASRGVEPGSRVALFMQRSPLAIVGMLAALRAGCSYVPINAGQRAQRTEELLNGCGAAAVFTTSTHREELPAKDLPVLWLDETVPDGHGQALEAPGPSDTAYVIYTSGSTGTPKGVVISHANLAASTAARSVFYPTAPKAFLLLSPIEFDSSVVGIYWTLTSGGTLVLPPIGDEQDVAALANAIEEHQITDLLCLPSLLELLFTYAPAGSLASLKTAISAGEELMESCHAAWQDHAPHVRLHNEYGPTEATVWCTACEVSPDLFERRFPIGQPIPGAHHYVRDTHQRPVPQGLPGELWVGGPGVAQGYLDNSELTASRFVPDPLETTSTVYRTGDIVRHRPDGMLDYLGRADHQVKVRGHRVELGEIEATLTARSDISAAAVVDFASGRDTRLAAFVVLEHHVNLAVDTLRQELRSTLPDWMIPQRFVVIADMPKTATGKIDRNALILPADESAGEIVEPRTPLEKDLAAIWKDILWLDRDIGVHEDFAELGGHSLLSIRLVNEVQEQLGKTLPITQIGRLTTIAEQAEQIEKTTHQSDEAAPTPALLVGAGSSLFQGLDQDQLNQMHAYMAGWPGTPVWEGALYRGLNTEGTLPPLFWCFNWGEEFAALAKALGSDQPLYGTRSGHLILDVVPETQQWDNRRVAMQSVEEVLKLQPEGPYYLGGNCQGAAIAMETAQILNGLALPVGLVLMMEAVTDHAFHGNVSLLFGEASEMNPYNLEDDPDVLWTQRYLNYTVDTIRGQHGHFFKDRNIKQLAHTVAQRLAEARNRVDAPAPPSLASEVAAPEQTDQQTQIAAAADVLLSQARALGENGAVAEALEIAETVFRLQPDDFEALKFMGLLHADQGDTDRAESLIRRALGRQDDPLLRARLAQIEKFQKENNKIRYKLRSNIRRITGRS